MVLAIGISVTFASNHTSLQNTSTNPTSSGINTNTGGWSDPPSTPPFGNVSPPINTSNFNQKKDGGLEIGGILDVKTETFTKTLWSDDNTHLAFTGGVTTVGSFADDPEEDTQSDLEVFGDIIVEANNQVDGDDGSITLSNLSNGFSDLQEAQLCASASGKIVLCKTSNLVVDLDIASGFPNQLDAFGFHFGGNANNHGTKLEWIAQSNQIGDIECERIGGAEQWTNPKKVDSIGTQDIAAFDDEQTGTWVNHEIQCSQSLQSGGAILGSASEPVFVSELHLDVDPNWEFQGCEWFGHITADGIVATPPNGNGAYNNLTWTIDTGGVIHHPNSTSTEVSIQVPPEESSVNFEITFEASRFNPTAGKTIHRSTTESYTFELPDDTIPC